MMTISNTSMLFASFLGGASVDAAISDSMHIQLASADGEQIDLSEQDFLTMLNQNMVQLVSDVDGQVIDNQELLSMLGGLEGDSGSLAGTTLPGQWMQFLKSHFSEQSDAGQPLELVITEETEDDESVVLLQAALTTSDDGKDVIPAVAVMPSEQLKGEALPSGRQSLTTDATRSLIGDQLSTEKPLTDGMMDGERDEMSAETGKRQLTEGQLKESAGRGSSDFAAVRQQVAAAESANRIASDANVSATVLPTASPATAASATQNTQLLPPHLQALSVSSSGNNQQWGDALGERVSFLINNKLNSAEIRIDPPQLGKLDIQIHIKDDSAQVVIHTQHAQTRDLVESSSFRLREILQEAGYSSVDVNVSHQDSSSQQNAAQQADVNTSDEASHTADTAGMVDHVVQQTSLTLPNGRIDYFA